VIFVGEELTVFGFAREECEKILRTNVIALFSRHVLIKFILTYLLHFGLC